MTVRAIVRPIVRPIVRGIVGGLSTGFVPNAAFFASAKGFAYDFTNPSGMFQTSAGATAVISDGDPIGYVTDLSGNGKHGTQASAAVRPLFAAASGAVCDGTKNMTAGTLDLSGTGVLTVIACVQTSVAATQGIFQHGSFNPGDASLLMNTALGNQYASTMYGVTTNPQTKNTRGVLSSAFSVVSFAMDRAQATPLTEIITRVNGEAYGNTQTAAGASGTALFASRTANIMTYFGGTMLNGKLARILVIGRALSVAEMFQAEQWCAQGGGLSLISELPPVGQTAYQMLDSYGQSLSVGAPNDTPISLATRFPGDTMFVTHLKTSVAGVSFASLVPLVETIDTLSAVPCAETPIAGMAELLHEQVGFTGSALGIVTGFPSLTIAQCSVGQAQYNSRLTAITAAWRRGREAYKHTKMFAFNWLQGEADGANSTYASDLNNLRVSINTDVKAITLQTENIWCLSYQLDRAKIGLAHLSAQETYSNIVVAFPMYFLARNADGIHFVSSSSKIAGAYFGLAYKRIVIDGNTGWKPLMCRGSTVASAVLDLTFNPVGALAFDTTIVAAQTNQGFRLFNSDGITAQTISSVALVGTDTVRITASAPLPAGSILRYGFSDPADHTSGVSKGNLRDSQGASIVFGGGGLNYPMHNWCVLFQRTVN